MRYEKCPFCESGKVFYEGEWQICDWCRGGAIALSPLYEDIEAINLESAYNQQINAVYPVQKLDSLDLENYEIYECLICGGMGEEHYMTPDGDEGWCECSECHGSGELAILNQEI